MSDSAYDLAVELFNDFRTDAFFAPAFKAFSWDEIVESGDVFSGGSTVTTTHSGQCAELGGSAKAKKIATLDGILSTDKYVKGLVEEISPPSLDQEVTFAGEKFRVVNKQIDPVNATFELFLRA